MLPAAKPIKMKVLLHQFSPLMLNLHYIFFFYSVVTRPPHCSIAALFWEMPHYNQPKGSQERKEGKPKKKKTQDTVGAFFPVCFLPCTSCSRGGDSRRLVCLRSHVLRAYCNFESKQAISINLFGRRPNTKNVRKHQLVMASLENTQSAASMYMRMLMCEMMGSEALLS